MTRMKLCEIKIEVWATDAKPEDGGTLMSTDMAIEIHKGSALIPDKVARGAALGGLEAAYQTSMEDWEREYGDDRIRLGKITELASWEGPAL